MELRYHTCGHCIRVRNTPRHWDVAPMFFDGAEELHGAPITICPHCGQALTLEALQTQPHGVAATLESWTKQWPALHRQIDAQLAEVLRRDPAFYPYHAEQAITDFAAALQLIADLTLQLSDQRSATLLSIEPFGGRCRQVAYRENFPGLRSWWKQVPP